MLQHTQCLLQACPYLPPTNRDRDITCPTGVPGRGDKAASAPRIHVSPIMPEQGHSQHGTQGSMSWHWRVWRCNWKGNLCRFLRSYLKTSLLLASTPASCRYHRRALHGTARHPSANSFTKAACSYKCVREPAWCPSRD